MIFVLTGFQAGPTFPIFPTFPYFFDLLLLFPLFHENALLSLLFHSKMSFTRKNPQNFARSLRSLKLYTLTVMFIQRARCYTPQILNFNPKSLSVKLVLLSQVFVWSFSLRFLISNNSL